MRFSSLSLSVLPLLPLLAPVHGQDQPQGSNSTEYGQECVKALQDAGFTGLANILTQVNETEQGQALLTELSSGKNYTVFAPDNEAIQKVPSSVSGNNALLAEYLSYHIISGTFQNSSYTNTSAGAGGGTSSSTSSASSSTESSSSTASSESSSDTSTTTADSASAPETPTATAALFGGLFGRQDSGNSSSGGNSSSSSSPQPFAGVWPNVTIGRTLLNASDLVMLEGNKSQVLAWTRSGENGNVTILNQAFDSQNITVVNGTVWKNLFVNGINGVLTPPGNLTTALTAVNATAAQNVLSSGQLPTSNGTNSTALEVLESARGITVFVPNNDAFTTEVNQTLQGLQNNQTAQTALLQNHYINGTTLYSTEIANNSQVITAAGEPLTFSQNDTGLFVSGANGSTAQIVRPDVLLQNGVAHIVDRVFVVESADPSAASSAYESATSEAAISTTETGPIGVAGAGSATATTQSSESSSTSSSESSSSSSSSSSSESSTESSQSTATETSTSDGGGDGDGTATATATVTGTRSRLFTSRGMTLSVEPYLLFSMVVSGVIVLAL